MLLQVAAGTLEENVIQINVGMVHLWQSKWDAFTQVSHGLIFVTCNEPGSDGRAP